MSLSKGRYCRSSVQVYWAEGQFTTVAQRYFVVSYDAQAVLRCPIKRVARHVFDVQNRRFSLCCLNHDFFSFRGLSVSDQRKASANYDRSTPTNEMTSHIHPKI